MAVHSRRSGKLVVDAGQVDAGTAMAHQLSPALPASA